MDNLVIEWLSNDPPNSQLTKSSYLGICEIVHGSCGVKFSGNVSTPRDVCEFVSE